MCYNGGAGFKMKKKNDEYTPEIYSKYGKELKKVSYLLLLNNGKETTIATDSRETFDDGTFEDNRQKIFYNKDKSVAVAMIGPIKRNVNGKIYDIQMILADKILNGVSIVETLNFEVENELSIRKLLRLHYKSEVLTIAKIVKGGQFEIVEYNIKDNNYIFWDNINIFYSGDFPPVYTGELLGKEFETFFLNKEVLENKALEVMKNIVEISDYVSKKINKNSTIGGDIQIITI